MATVDGLTAAAMEALRDDTVIGGHISGDNLVLEKYDETEVVAGNVRGPQGVPGEVDMDELNAIFEPQYSTVLGKIRAILGRGQVLPVPIAALGHSYVAGLQTTRSEYRWVDQALRRLQAAYPSGIPEFETSVAALGAANPRVQGIHLYQGGVSGSYANSYTSSPVPAQINVLQPRLIFHMIGTNDQIFPVTPASFQTSLAAALTNMDAQCTIPPVHIVVATGERLDLAAPAHPWADYVAAMKAVVDARPSTAFFVDANRAFVAAQASGFGATDPNGLMDFDQVHPSNVGHNLLAQEVASALRLPETARRRQPNVFDRFERAALGNAETGHPWVVQSGAWVPGTTGLQCTTLGRLAVATTFSNAEASAIINFVEGTSAGVFVKSANDTTRIAAFLNNTDRVALLEGTNLLNWVDMPITSGDYHLAIQVIDAEVKIHLNGQHVLTHTLDGATATAYAGRSSHGVLCNETGSANRWRNFAVRAL